MKEAFCSLETTKLLERVGFFPSFDCVMEICNENGESVNLSDNTVEHFYQKPTLQVAASWLREEKNLHTYAGLVRRDDDSLAYFPYYIDMVKRKGYLAISGGIDIAHADVHAISSYEGAHEAAIVFCLEKLIKESV